MKHPAKEPINRRTFIKASLVSFFLLAIFVGASWINRDRLAFVQARGIAKFLRQNFHYLDLKVTDHDIEQFYTAYKIHYRKLIRFKWERLLKGRSREYFESRLDHVATTFLMSTDFFLNGADETKPVRYVRLYHSYASPCWQPVSAANFALLSNPPQD